MKRSTFWLVAIAPAIFIGAAFAAEKKAASEASVPLGLLPVQWPTDNPYSKEKVELGRLLYFDRRLSADGTVSCASFHHLKFAFPDGVAVPIGIQRKMVGRSAPIVFNQAY